MIRELMYFNNPILKKKCEEVTEFDEDLKQLVQDMKDTMIRYKGVGLAAPQIGVSKRVIIFTDGVGNIRSLINPRITNIGKVFEIEEEGCLSYPKISKRISRPNVIVVEGQTVDGYQEKFSLFNIPAHIICHEIDHLNGVCKVGAKL